MHSFLAAFSVDTARIRLLYKEARALSEQRLSNRAASLAGKALEELSAVRQRPLDVETGLYNVLGDCALERGDYAEALEHYQRSAQLLAGKVMSEGLLAAEVYNKLGNFYLEFQDYAQAKTYLDRALAIRRKHLGSRHLKIAEVYNNLGIYLYFTGDYDQALELHRQALAIRLEQLPRPHPQIAQSYNNIGLDLEKKGQKEEALDYYQQAIDIYSQLKMPQTLADVYTNMAGVYAELGYPAFFLEYQNRALQIWRKTLDKEHPFLALCYTNLANYYTSYTAEYRKAFQLHQQALAIRLRNYGEVHPLVAATYYNIGANYYFDNQWEKANEAFQQCFYALNYQPGSASSFEEVNDNGVLLRLFERLVETHLDAYNKTADAGHMFKAFSYLEQADRLLDFLRIRYQPDGSKLQLASTSHPIYDWAIELALILWQITGEEKYLHEAFSFSEKSKGIVLLEALKKTEAEAFSGIPAETIARIKNLESNIAQLEKRLFLASDPKKRPDEQTNDTLGHQLFEKKQQLYRLIRSIQQEYPAYYRLRYASSTIPIARIQEELLKPGQTMVEYFLGSGRLHIFVINKDRFAVRSREIGAELYDRLTDLQTSIRQFPTVPSKDIPENVRLYADAASDLYDLLIAPVADLLAENLIIIPDGELGYVPFEALLSAYPGDLNRFADYPFLIRGHSLSYNYSSTLLQEMMEPKSQPRLRPYLGFAPVFEEGNGKGLSPLIYNAEEVRGVKKMIGGRIFTNGSATKRNFLTNQARYKILHLATHGKVNDAEGDFSFLAFSETPESPGDEALLHVKEIYNLPTHAEMVVLSACDSGAGELYKGEGIASIARSFSYVGAKSLIATHWSVDDRAARELILAFFGNIRKGASKDAALRAAKLSFIQSGGNKYAHPFFWASLVPIGNMNPISLPDHRFFYFIPLLVVCLLSFYLWLVRRKKSISGRTP